MLSELRAPLPEGCLTDLGFDEWHAGELDPVRTRASELHVASCHACQARKQMLLSAASAFLEQHPDAPRLPSGQPDVLEPPRARAAGRSRLRALGLGIAGLALAAAFAVLVRPRPVTEGPESALETRAKGRAKLGFFVKRGGRVFEGADGETLRAGDQLRFVATSGGLRQLAILSRDGRGAASVYYPPLAHSRALTTAAKTALDAAVELDATPGEEYLFGVFCDTQFEIEPLRSTLERTGKLPNLKGCTIDQLRVFKEAR